MPPWRLTADEWKVLKPIAAPTSGPAPRGRPRQRVTKKLVEACLYRHHHSRSPRTGHSFGWNALPASFGISPATANRRYNEWLGNGMWGRLWEALLSLRRTLPGWPAAPSCEVHSPLRSPVASTVVWLERAYQHFNDTLFGGGLPRDVIITLEVRARAGRKYAFFCAGGWQSRAGGRIHHIMVSSHACKDGAEAALSALLHEAVHARCHHLRLPDTSDRQYHNRHFRDTALVSGLRCGPRHPDYGYAETTPDERGRAATESFLATHPFPGDPNERA